MGTRISGVVSGTVCVLLMARAASPCSVVVSSSVPLDRTKAMVAGADLILRATALGYAVPPGDIRTSGVPESRVRFSVEEVVKGSYASRELVLPGYLSERDEWNPGRSPYIAPRHSADASCFSNAYRQGAQFLLLLQPSGKVPDAFSANTEYSVNWHPLGPVNEQLQSAGDPWVQWVREQVKAN